MKVHVTSSLYSFPCSRLPGYTSWIWPVVKPTSSEAPSHVAVNWLKSWQLGLVPLYSFLSIGLLRSAACGQKERIEINCETVVWLMNKSDDDTFRLADFANPPTHGDIYFGLHPARRDCITIREHKRCSGTIRMFKSSAVHRYSKLFLIKTNIYIFNQNVLRKVGAHE